MHERDILLAALERTQPGEREAYLAQACGTDAELRSRVDALLRASEVQDSFLEQPAIETEVLSRQTDAIRRKSAEHEELSLEFLHPTDDPQVLGRLGPYEVMEVVGRGGMGVVLKARDSKLNRIVAIKVMVPELASNPTARKRFQREAHAAASIVHQHIVTIHAVDEDRLPYLVMECIDGQSLQDKIDREGHLQPIEILRIGQQVAAGLAAAHAHGLIHRDVKPANILLENGIERARISDFGLARAVDDVGMTRTGEVAGTPQYMSPEQAQGLPLDGRSDLFSFGCVLYAMCTGRPPFRAETAFATARRVCEATPRPIREVNPEIPEWLIGIIERLLKKDAAERFQSAKEVAELLGQYLAHAQRPAIVPLPGKEPVPPKGKPGVRRRRWSVAVVALLAVAFVVGLTDASGVTSFVPTVIRIVRGEGTLVIEVADPTVQVSLDGEEISIRGAGLQELRLLPGKYRLHAMKDGQPVKDEVVTITRDGRKVVTVTLELPGGTGFSSVAPEADEPPAELTLLAKLQGPTNLVHAVAFLPDGKRVVSVDRNKLARIWDLETRSALSTLAMTGGHLWAADVSADGRFVALSTAADEKRGMIQVWDLENRNRICEGVQENVDYLTQIRFSPDGTRVVTSGKPSVGVLWDVSTGKEVQRFEMDAFQTHAVEFSPDGRLLAMGAVGRVRLFDVASGDVLVNTQLPNGGAVISLAFAPGGNSLACGQMDGYTSIIDVNSRQLTGSLTHSKSSSHVVSMRFLDNQRLLLTRFHGALEVWDLARTKIVATAASETGTTKRLAISLDGHYALSAHGEGWDDQSNSPKPTGDYALRLWQLPESVWPNEQAPTSPTKQDAGGSRVARQAEPITGELKLLAMLDGHSDAVRGVAFSPDGRQMVSVSRDKMVRIWDTETRSVLSTLAVEGYVRDADVSADGRLLATASTRSENVGVIHVWNLDKRERVCELVQAGTRIERIRFSPDGTHVVTGGFPSGGVLWDLTTKTEVRRFDVEDPGTPTLAVAFSPDGRLLAIGVVGRVRLFDVESGDVVGDAQLPRNRAVLGLAFAPSGKSLACGQMGGQASLVDVELCQVTTSLPVSDSNAHVPCVRFLDNGRFLLATYYGDAALRIWDIERVTVLATVATEKGTNERLGVSPDGRHAVTSGGEAWDDSSKSLKPTGDYALRLWQLPESVWPQGIESSFIAHGNGGVASDAKEP